MDIKQTKSRSATRVQNSTVAARAKAQASVEVKASIAAIAKGKVGQPSKFSPELWEEILEAVATYQDLIHICTQPHMPAVSTIYRWMRENPALKDDMRTAWEMFSMLGRSYNQNILSGGIMSTGDIKRDVEMAADNRWHMGKTNRRDFGDRQLVEHTVHEPFVMEGWMLPGNTALPSALPPIIDAEADED